VAADSSCFYAGAGFPILHHRKTTFEEEFRTFLKKTAWHSMNDIYRTDSLAAPSGQVVIGNGYQGLKPLAESCHPFGMSPTRSSRDSADTFVQWLRLDISN
jgi:hypothetical protein